MESIWTATCEIPRYPPLKGDLRTDVLVIGGGMAGILCAHMLQKAGIDYALVEANRLGWGITKNTTAKSSVMMRLPFPFLIVPVCSTVYQNNAR